MVRRVSGWIRGHLIRLGVALVRLAVAFAHRVAPLVRPVRARLAPVGDAWRRGVAWLRALDSRQRTSYAITAAGALVGLRWAFPLADVTRRCPPKHEGQVFCELQKQWGAAATKFLIALIVARLVVKLVLDVVPAVSRRYRAGERLRRRDPLTERARVAGQRDLHVASWGLPGSDAPERRPPPWNLISRIALLFLGLVAGIALAVEPGRDVVGGAVVILLGLAAGHGMAELLMPSRHEAPAASAPPRPQDRVETLPPPPAPVELGVDEHGVGQLRRRARQAAGKEPERQRGDRPAHGG